MAEPRSRPPVPARAEDPRSTTTLLARRLPAAALGRAIPVLALAGNQRSVAETGAVGNVYVLADVGASDDDEPLAAALTTSPTPRGDVVVAAVAVVASWRGRGLGGRLLGEVVDDLRAEGIRSAWASIPPGQGDGGDGAACRRLFAGCGFRPCEPPTGWGRKTEEHWVRLEL